MLSGNWSIDIGDGREVPAYIAGHKHGPQDAQPSFGTHVGWTLIIDIRDGREMPAYRAGHKHRPQDAQPSFGTHVGWALTIDMERCTVL